MERNDVRDETSKPAANSSSRFSSQRFAVDSPERVRQLAFLSSRSTMGYPHSILNSTEDIYDIPVSPEASGNSPSKFKYTHQQRTPTEQPPRAISLSSDDESEPHQPKARVTLQSRPVTFQRTPSSLRSHQSRKETRVIHLNQPAGNSSEKKLNVTTKEGISPQQGAVKPNGSPSQPGEPLPAVNHGFPTHQNHGWNSAGLVASASTSQLQPAFEYPKTAQEVPSSSNDVRSSFLAAQKANRISSAVKSPLKRTGRNEVCLSDSDSFNPRPPANSSSVAKPSANNNSPLALKNQTHNSNGNQRLSEAAERLVRLTTQMATLAAELLPLAGNTTDRSEESMASQSLDLRDELNTQQQHLPSSKATRPVQLVPDGGRGQLESLATPAWPTPKPKSAFHNVTRKSASVRPQGIQSDPPPRPLTALRSSPSSQKRKRVNSETGSASPVDASARFRLDEDGLEVDELRGQYQTPKESSPGPLSEEMPTPASTPGGHSRRKAKTGFDQDAMDEAIYAQLDSTRARPSSPSLWVPETEKTHRYLPVDPRIHWTRDRSEAWLAVKRAGLPVRGRRKANFGRAAASERESQRRLREQKRERDEALARGSTPPPRRDVAASGVARPLDLGDLAPEELPDMVKANPAWVEACAWLAQVRGKGAGTPGTDRVAKAHGARDSSGIGE